MAQNPKLLNTRLRNCQNELQSLTEQIKALNKRRKELKDEIELITKQIDSPDDDQNNDRFYGQFAWTDQAQHLLESVFKLKTFRSHQLAAINATLSGADVLLILPTGGGKSLCFQLTALISKGRRSGGDL